MTKFMTAESLAHRGFSEGGVVHYVEGDEFRDFTPICYGVRNRVALERVDESTALVNCLQCLALYGG